MVGIIISITNGTTAAGISKFGLLVNISLTVRSLVNIDHPSQQRHQQQQLQQQQQQQQVGHQ